MRGRIERELFNVIRAGDRSVIRVAIADDHAVVRAGLRDLLSSAPDMHVVGEAANGRQIIELVAALQVDVVVLDLMMPGASSSDTLVGLRSTGRAPAILMLSGHAMEQHAPSALRQGASGFISKTCEPSEILQAVRAVAAGRPYVGAPLAAPLEQIRQMKAPHELLSRREREVFVRLASGQMNSQIATALGVSVKTVATFRARVVRKLHLASNSDLTYYAVVHRLIS